MRSTFGAARSQEHETVVHTVSIVQTQKLMDVGDHLPCSLSIQSKMLGHVRELPTFRVDLPLPIKSLWKHHNPPKIFFLRVLPVPVNLITISHHAN